MGRQAVLQLADLAASGKAMAQHLQPVEPTPPAPSPELAAIAAALQQLAEAAAPNTADHAPLLAALEHATTAMAEHLAPVAHNLHKISDIDRRTLHNLRVLAKKLEAVGEDFSLKGSE